MIRRFRTTARIIKLRVVDIEFINVLKLNTFSLTKISFSKDFCKEHIQKYGSSNGMAIQFDIDWRLIHYEFEYDQFYVPMLNDFFKRKEEGKVTPEEDFAIQRLMREATNVAVHTIIKMMAVK